MALLSEEFSILRYIRLGLPAEPDLLDRSQMRLKAQNDMNLDDTLDLWTSST
jgi:hypothetical protein